MANYCNYLIRAKGTKKAALMAFASTPKSGDFDYIIAEFGTEEEYVVWYQGECKWSLDAYSQKYEGTKIDLSEFSEEALRNGEGYDFWNLSMKDRSKLFGLDLFAHSWSGESMFDEYERWENGHTSASNKERHFELLKDDEGISADDGLTAGSQLMDEIEDEPHTSNASDFLINDGSLYNYVGPGGGVVVPEGVTRIGRAFAHKHEVGKITIPKSVTEISYDAFRDCARLTKVTISNGVTSIGGSAFEDCVSLTDIDIPEGVTVIDYATFKNCKSLEKLELPDSLTEILAEAFYGCWRLKEINIPSAVTRVGYKAFKDCVKLPFYKDSSGAKYLGNKENPYLVLMHATSGAIHPLTKVIYGEAFQDCSLEEITISEHITQIGNSTFAKQKGLTVTFAGAIPKIESKALDGCKEIITLNISGLPSEYKHLAVQGFLRKYAAGEADEAYIANYTPYIKRQLKTLLKKLKGSIELYAFLMDNKLFPVENADEILKGVEDPVLQKKVIEYKNSLMTSEIATAMEKKEKRHEELLLGAVPTIAEAKEVWRFKVTDDNTIEIRGYKGKDPAAEIPSKIGIKTVTAIAENAFKGNAVLKSIRIPEGITRIEAFAFYKCPALTDIAIPDGVTTIGEHAFSDCKSLTSITIPSSVTTIGEYAFEKCKSLTSITIPGSVTTIGEFAFGYCKSLTSVTILDGVTTIGKYAFSDCKSLTSITIPGSVTTIDVYAFDNCDSLTSITVPDSVTTIGARAFLDCKSLTSITIPNSVTTIGAYAFVGCKKLTIRCKPGSCAETYAKENDIPFVAE